MRSSTTRILLYCVLIAILVAISARLVVKKVTYQQQIDTTQNHERSTGGTLKQHENARPIVQQRPRDAVPHPVTEDRHAEEYLGRTEALKLLSRHLKPADLESELFVFKEQLSITAFGKLMVGISTSEDYTPAEKARYFNVLLPNSLHPKEETRPGLPPYTVYNDVFREWGNVPENHDAFLDFIDELNSPGIQRMLTCNYLQSNFSDLESFAALIKKESDLSKPSYLGAEITRRLGNLDWLMDSMMSSGKYSAAEIRSALEKMEIDPAFKNGLIKELNE
jgi:hypothetical protein